MEINNRIERITLKRPTESSCSLTTSTRLLQFKKLESPMKTQEWHAKRRKRQEENDSLIDERQQRYQKLLRPSHTYVPSPRSKPGVL
ncbi:hypothetical protein BDV33DRAFT_185276 [Aspergillus novoparasiticus]|uniref:Uncharacterized protein n=1 Tax=Aspergillus novoparasiticus TaxID=986946 RepID=A0A5N6E7C0_9EURO|nr:hypothetical protein BDV33DRAFT_185276 [Aspergillus novoparasiticus]